MSRIAKAAVAVPAGVEVTCEAQQIRVKGAKGSLALDIHSSVQVQQDAGALRVQPKVADKSSWAMAGTMRALVNNLVTGVSQGFQKKLQLVGVGYRAQSKGKVLNLSLGFSHPVNYPVPEGITVETTSQTEIIVSGCDKQQVGQVAAEIRRFRPPEPYKGKGVRYVGEKIIRKEAKKK